MFAAVCAITINALDRYLYETHDCRVLGWREGVLNAQWEQEGQHSGGQNLLRDA